MRKRQQVGRGLRLPVMSNGERCRIDEINLLTIIANEAFSTFADALQREIEEETDVKFDKRIVDLKKDKVKLGVKREILEDPIFKALWARISRHTSYSLDFDSNQVVSDALTRINAMEVLEPIRFRIEKSEIRMSAKGLSAIDTRDRGTVDVAVVRRLPDIVGELCRRVPLSRATIVRVLTECDQLDQAKVNPSVFIDRVAEHMNQAVYNQVVDGIVYRALGDQRWEANRFIDAHQEETVAPIVIDVSKSITNKIVCESKVEEAFAKYLDHHAEIRFFLKLPGWFTVPTPLGNYNPDWALVREEKHGNYVYLVRETKGGDDIDKLRFESEGWKIKCGYAHFGALKVDFAFGHDPEILIEATPYKSASHRDRT